MTIRTTTRKSAGAAPLASGAHIIAAVDYFQSDGIVGYHDRDWFQQLRAHRDADRHAGAASGARA